MTTSATNRHFRISVIIPCFNHGEFLGEAIQSVQRIGSRGLELVVVDDGSTDDRTRQEIGAIAASGIRVIRQKNKGLGAARNAGVRASQGEYIFPLDADDLMRSGWIDTAIATLKSDPKIGVVYGDAQCFGTRTDRWQVGDFKAERLLHWNFIHASALFRRSVWEQNGGYAETMPVQGLEDWDFWLGALERGWRFAYMREVFFNYRRTDNSMITRTAGFEDQVREFVAKKHGLLYHEAWLSVVREREAFVNERASIKWNLRNLQKLLASRLRAWVQNPKNAVAQASGENLSR